MVSFYGRSDSTTGNASVDLSNYYTKTKTDNLISKSKEEILEEIRKMLICVTVIVKEGMDLTITDGTYTYNYENLTEDKNIYLPSDGTWTFTGKTGEEEKIISLETEPYNFYTVRFKDKSSSDPSGEENKGSTDSTANSELTVVGVVWDYSNEDSALTRLTPSTDPLGVVTLEITGNFIPAADTLIVGSSPFDEIYPWCDMIPTNVDLTTNTYTYKLGEEGFSYENETVVPINKFYYKVVDDAENSKRYWYVSNKKIDGFSLHPGSGRAVSKYWISSGDFKSTTGRTESDNGSADYYYVAAIDTSSETTDYDVKTLYEESHNPTYWALMDYACYCAILLLALIETATFDIDDAISGGKVLGFHNDGMSIMTSDKGVLDDKQYGTGYVETWEGSVSSLAFQYRWIENLYGSGGSYLSGLKWSCASTNSPYGAFYICTDPSKDIPCTAEYCLEQNIANGEGLARYYDIKIASQVLNYEGFPSKLYYGEEAPWVFIGTEDQGSSSTYIQDRTFMGWYANGYENSSEDSTTYASVFTTASHTRGSAYWENGFFSLSSIGSAYTALFHSMFTPTGSWTVTDEED